MLRVADRDRQRVRGVGRFGRAGQPQQPGHHGGHLRLVGPSVAGDGSLDFCRSVEGDRQLALPGQATPVWARAAGAAGDGRGLVLCVRPERLRLLPADAEGLVGTVQDLIHQGDHWRLIVRLAGQAEADAPWHVKLPPGPAPAGATPGAAVRLGFAPDEACVFAA